MSFIDPSWNFGIGVGVAFACTSMIVSALSGVRAGIDKLDRRGMDIEHQLRVMQQSVDNIAGSVDDVEKNTRN